MRCRRWSISATASHRRARSAPARALVKAASDAIRKRYRYDWQEVGAALRTRSGKVFTGVSLDAYLGRMAICAEAVALGQAITIAGETGIEMIVAVRHRSEERRVGKECRSRWS